MNANQVISTARQVLCIAAVVCAGIVLVKVFRLVHVPFSTMDLTCAAIACALAGR